MVFQKPALNCVNVKTAGTEGGGGRLRGQGAEQTKNGEKSRSPENSPRAAGKPCRRRRGPGGTRRLQSLSLKHKSLKPKESSAETGKKLMKNKALETTIIIKAGRPCQAPSGRGALKNSTVSVNRRKILTKKALDKSIFPADKGARGGSRNIS